MEHRYTCKKCGATIYAYCFEHMGYTEAGWEIRKRQLDASLCIPCFGEVPERGVFPESARRFVKIDGTVVDSEGKKV